MQTTTNPTFFGHTHRRNFFVLPISSKAKLNSLVWYFPTHFLISSGVPETVLNKSEI